MVRAADIWNVIEVIVFFTEETKYFCCLFENKYLCLMKTFTNRVTLTKNLALINHWHLKLIKAKIQFVSGFNYTTANSGNCNYYCDIAEEMESWTTQHFVPSHPLRRKFSNGGMINKFALTFPSLMASFLIPFTKWRQIWLLLLKLSRSSCINFLHYEGHRNAVFVTLWHEKLYRIFQTMPFFASSKNSQNKSFCVEQLKFLTYHQDADYFVGNLKLNLCQMQILSSSIEYY